MNSKYFSKNLLSKEEIIHQSTNLQLKKIMVCKSNMTIDETSTTVVYTKEKKTKFRKGLDYSQKKKWEKGQRLLDKSRKQAREQKRVSNNIYGEREYITYRKNKREIYTPYDATKEHKFSFSVPVGCSPWEKRWKTVTDADIQLMSFQEYESFKIMYNDFLKKE